VTEEFVVRESIEINAPATRVWTVLTDPEYTKQYMFNCEAISDWQPGSSLIWRGATNGVVYVTGHIEKIEPAKLLQYTTFDPNSPDLEDIPSNYTSVTEELSESDGRTRLNVTQGDFAGIAEGEKRFEDAHSGWAGVLQKIKEIAESLPGK
jgi:uncharacterized protein YndB with AHSA1/START domain